MKREISPARGSNSDWSELGAHASMTVQTVSPDNLKGVQFRTGDLARDLAARMNLIGGDQEEGPSASTLAKRDLERYYRLLDSQRPAFSLNEAGLIVDALASAHFDHSSCRYLWAEIDDAVRSRGLAEKWEVDGDKLVERLRRLTPFQSMAVIDAAEQYWASHFMDPIFIGLADVGLGVRSEE